MKNKSIIILMAGLLMAALALGLSGAVKLADPAKGEDAAAQGGDRLIGALVTRESLDLFDMEGYINAHVNELASNMEISGEDSAAYEGRLYAVLAETKDKNEDGSARMEYVFEGVEGMRYFAPTMHDGDTEYFAACADDAVSDANTHVNCTDSGDSVSLEGTVYVSVNSDANVFHVNPVYQTASGEVYVMGGSGAAFGGDRMAGSSHSLFIEEKNSTTVNGETTGANSSVKVHFTLVAPPERITISQFDEFDALLSKAEYQPGQAPSELKAGEAAEYIIVETLSAGETTRELYQHGDETLSSFMCREDGICMKQATVIDWGD